MTKPTLAELLRRILSRPPHDPVTWDHDRAAFERGLREAATAGLMPEVERRLEELRAAGFTIELVEDKGHWREWKVGLDDKRYVASMTALAYPDMQSAHLIYKAAPKKLRRTRKDRLQEAFYARYNALWERLGDDPDAAMDDDDRRVLLVGDFEGDVNNGGFSQYLSNKGRERAALALAALQAIGAKRTARMLQDALEHENDAARLEALTDEFYESYDDVAALTARQLKMA